MTHYHYLIEANGDVLSSSSIFYLVAIGTGVQANRDFLALTAFCADRNDYFAIRSDKSDDFVLSCLKSLNMSLSDIRRVKARDLVRAYKQKERAVSALPNGHAANFQRKALNIGFRIAANLAKKRKM